MSNALEQASHWRERYRHTQTTFSNTDEAYQWVDRLIGELRRLQGLLDCKHEKTTDGWDALKYKIKTCTTCFVVTERSDREDSSYGVYW